jgi:hypothetical protein
MNELMSKLINPPYLYIFFLVESIIFIFIRFDRLDHEKEKEKCYLGEKTIWSTKLIKKSNNSYLAFTVYFCTFMDQVYLELIPNISVKKN